MKIRRGGKGGKEEWGCERRIEAEIRLEVEIRRGEEEATVEKN